MIVPLAQFLAVYPEVSQSANGTAMLEACDPVCICLTAGTLRDLRERGAGLHFCFHQICPSLCILDDSAAVEIIFINFLVLIEFQFCAGIQFHDVFVSSL